MSKTEIRGITPQCDIVKCGPGHPVMQFCETDIIPVCCGDPDIQEILNVSVAVSIKDFKTVCTPLGKKVFVHADKCIKYVFKGSGTGSVEYSVQVEIPFCFFICIPECFPAVSQVCVMIEDIMASLQGARGIAVSVLLAAIPVVGSHCQGCGGKECKEQFKDREIRCDIKLNAQFPGKKS